MAVYSPWFRLIGAGWTLVRADALLPRELDSRLNAPGRALAAGLRLFAGPQARQGRAGERLARALETMGPVAIKAGQFLSTRPDIFGAAFTEDLSHLKDGLAPFPLVVARREVEASLNVPIETLFATFEEPVAAASVGQVHPATLIDGRLVAVKILRPGVERLVAEDSAAMRLAASLAELWPLARRLEPAALAATISRTLDLEMDLRFEAAGADELGHIMEQDGFMSAPKVVWPGVGRRVLTLEWAQGSPLSETSVLAVPGLDRRALAESLVRGFLAQALNHGVFHADLHEGNLFVSAPARLVAVDFGIIGRIGRSERRYLAEILWGFLRRDYRRVAEVHFEAGYVPATQDMAAFAQALRAVGEPMFGRKAYEVSMERLLTQLFEITALFHMRLRPELVLLQKTMVTVEGAARRIDPELDIWAAAEPVVKRWVTRELSPAARLNDIMHDAREVIGVLSRQVKSLEREDRPPLGGGILSRVLSWLRIAAVALIGAFLLSFFHIFR